MINDLYNKPNSEIEIFIFTIIIFFLTYLMCKYFYLSMKECYEAIKNVGISFNMNEETIKIFWKDLNINFFEINNENFEFFNNINTRLKGYIVNIKEDLNKKNYEKNPVTSVIKAIFTSVIAPILITILKNLSIENFNDDIIIGLFSIVFLFGIYIYFFISIYIIQKNIIKSRENKINNLLMYIHVELENKIENYTINKEKKIQDKEKVILDNEKWIYISNK